MPFCSFILPLSISFCSLYTTLVPSLWCSMDEAVTEDQQTDQRHSSGPETEIQSTPGLVDQEQEQREVLEDGLSVLEQVGNTSHHQHKKQQVRGFVVFGNCYFCCERSKSHVGYGLRHYKTAGIMMENLTVGHVVGGKKLRPRYSQRPYFRWDVPEIWSEEEDYFGTTATTWALSLDIIRSVAWGWVSPPVRTDCKTFRNLPSRWPWTL